MKQNLPTTDKEVTFDGNTTITSTTDLKGALTYINKEFFDRSDFSTEKLLGNNHNIVRHPDMPPAYFEDLWSAIKLGKGWMGLVKNKRLIQS